MSIYKGTTLLAGSSITIPLLTFVWQDHKINDISWLCADTFSWQSGSVYTAVYNHLVEDYNSSSYNTGTVSWTQPILTSNSTETSLGTVEVSAGSEYSTYNAYKALDGIKSGTIATTGWGVNNTSATTWWQIKFPYKIKITGLTGYQRYDSNPANANTIGQFYTSSDKTTPIGDIYTNNISTNWNAVAVSGIPSEGIITDTIYFEKTGGGSYGGLGELEITAERVVESPFYEAPDGHRIVLADQESEIQSIYNTTGVAWYYILDTENTRFKLPRTKYSFTGLRDTVGKYVSPNVSIQHYHAFGYNTNNNNGTFIATNDTGKSVTLPTVNNVTGYRTWNGSGGGGGFNSSSETYSSNMLTSLEEETGTKTIQPSATQMYLYFYVGQFTQSATEQTAGLNTELFNNKLDLRLSNVDNADNAASNALNAVGIRTVVETYHNGTDWYRVWSDGWCEQGGETLNVFNTNNNYISFLKPYATAPLNVTMQMITTGSTDAGYAVYQVKTVSASGFTTYWTQHAYWKAEGYIS